MIKAHLRRFLLAVFIVTLSVPSFADLAQNTTSNVGSSPDVTMSLLKVTGGLLLVIIAIFGSAWLFRRFGNMTPISNDALRIIGGVSMGQKERVVLMQVGEEQILLGVSPGRIQRLHVLEKNIDLDVDKTNVNEKRENKSFLSQLNSELKRRND